MAVIAVVGTSGIGKSLLVKQLASLYNAPAFFEGEEGTIPADILRSVFNDESPEKRWRWFLARYKSNLLKAHQISCLGIDCFTDGGVITARAIFAYEDKKHNPVFKEMIEDMSSLEADMVMLLVADKKTIVRLMKGRGRTSENNDSAVKRALFIQEEFKRLARKDKNILVIDRSQMDFYKVEVLSKITKKLDKALLLAKAKPL